MLGFALKQSKTYHPGIYESKLIKHYVAILKLIFAQSYFYIDFCAYWACGHGTWSGTYYEFGAIWIEGEGGTYLFELYSIEKEK